MNLRQVWTEIFQKPAGRLLLFLVIGGILLWREPQAQPDNTQVGKSATQTKAYSFNEEISPPARAQATPGKRVSDKMAHATPTPKPPPDIPQTIFATKEQSISELFLPYGRMLRCELVNTVDSASKRTNESKHTRYLTHPETALLFQHPSSAVLNEQRDERQEWA